jgi:hypothetical protein
MSLALIYAVAALPSLSEPRLLVPAPLLDAAMQRAMELVAPPMVCANGRRPWAAGDTSSAERQKRKREGDCAVDEGAGAEVRGNPKQCAMDAWEMQMLQMLAEQALTTSERNQGAPAVPPALACQLCQLRYGSCFTALLLLPLHGVAQGERTATTTFDCCSPNSIVHCARRAFAIFRPSPTRAAARDRSRGRNIEETRPHASF